MLKALLLVYVVNKVKECCKVVAGVAANDKDIILAYFRYHGVSSLNLIICPSNETSG